MPHDEPNAQLKTLWETVAAESFAFTETLSPADALEETIGTPPPGMDLVGGKLPALFSTEGDALRLEGQLGEGGMGVVHLARQRDLDREVAVKTLRTDQRDDASQRALVVEARMTGRMEHPHIIPVHALGLDDTETPMLVMKRVEGTSWQDALDDPTKLPAGVPGRDPLEAHLRILMQVCNALAFAHDRGVMHRDLKPDNVMIGRFGEVYVLD